MKIISVENEVQLKEFIQFPNSLYSTISHWIPPLYFERKQAIDPKLNPFGKHAQIKLFLVKEGNNCLGRISAQIDPLFKQYQKRNVAHFGFFESINDSKVSQLLLEAAENFAKENHAQEIEGPFHYSINQEVGLLVGGFDAPLMTMMPYHLPYYANLIEKSGYQKAKDFYAWHYEIGEVSSEACEISEVVKQTPGLKIREINFKNLESDLQIVLKILNSVWKNNWGFVPFSDAEVKNFVKEMKLILDPALALIAEVNGEAAGMCIAIPNIYDVISDLNGKLFPFNWTKLLYRLKKKKFQSLRLLLMGVEEKYRKSFMGGLSFLLYKTIHEKSKARGYKWGELSWTLEDNDAVNHGIEFMGGNKYKTYRVYGKKLT